MAVNLLENQNKQKYLIIILVALVLIALFMMRDNISKFFAPETSFIEVFSPQDIEINFGVLKGTALKELQIPAQEEPFSGTVGRDNPFLEY